MKIDIKITDAVPDKGQQGVNSYLYKQALGTIASCLITVCSSLIFGIAAVLVPQLRQDKSIQYDPSQDSWITSIASLSMIIGSVCCGQIVDSYGRKAAHIIIGIPFIIGWTFIACANSTTLIIVGRAITGLSTGANRAVTMVYIGEIADPKFRSTALLLPELAGHLGVLFSHVIGYYLYWKVSALICIVPAILSVFIFLFLKESPLWLIAKGRPEEGIKTFRWFRGTDENSEEELNILLQRQTEKPKMSSRETLNTVCSSSFVRPMLILLVLMLNVQCSGVNVVIMYSQDIFEQAFSGSVDAFLFMIVIDCIRGIIALCICLLAKRVPKRITFLSSSFGVSLSVLALIMCFMMKFENVWLPVLCIVMYIGFSSAIVTVGWTFVPELLPTNARGFGSGLNSGFAFISLFFLLKFAPDIINAYSASALFGFFGVSTFVFGLVLCFVLPETSGKTLQSIEDSYDTSKVEQTYL